MMNAINYKRTVGLATACIISVATQAVITSVTPVECYLVFLVLDIH